MRDTTRGKMAFIKNLITKYIELGLGLGLGQELALGLVLEYRPPLLHLTVVTAGTNFHAESS